MNKLDFATRVAVTAKIQELTRDDKTLQAPELVQHVLPMFEKSGLEPEQIRAVVEGVTSSLGGGAKVDAEGAALLGAMSASFDLGNGRDDKWFLNAIIQLKHQMEWSFTIGEDKAPSATQVLDAVAQQTPVKVVSYRDTGRTISSSSRSYYGGHESEGPEIERNDQTVSSRQELELLLELGLKEIGRGRDARSERSW